MPKDMYDEMVEKTLGKSKDYGAAESAGLVDFDKFKGKLTKNLK